MVLKDCYMAVEESERVKASLDVYTWVFSTSDTPTGSDVLGPSSIAFTSTCCCLYSVLLHEEVALPWERKVVAMSFIVLSKLAILTSLRGVLKSELTCDGPIAVISGAH